MDETADLASRRKDLEREFDAKQRELKAQHKRQMDRLDQDRAEWESYKRSQQQAIADQAEKAHRRADNKAKAEETKAAAQEDAAELRVRLQEAEKAKLKATAANDDLAARAAKAQKRLGPATTLLTLSTLFGVAAGATWLWTAWTLDQPLAAPGVAFAVALLLLAFRLRLK